MLKKLVAFTLSSLLGLTVCYSFYSIFLYFTFSTPPSITLEQSLQEQYYRTTLPIALSISSDYKIREAVISIDNQPIAVNELASCYGMQTFNTHFTLPIDNLDNGEHTLSIQASDKSYKTNKKTLETSFVVDKEPLSLSYQQKELITHQGSTVHLTFESNKPLTNAQIQTLGSEYTCYQKSPEGLIYEAFIPIECEQMPENTTLTITAQDKSDNQITDKLTLTVKEMNFPKQKGFTVSKQKLEVEKEASMSNNVLRSALAQWLKDSPSEKLWNGPFIKPIEVQRMSTPFGEVRTTPERGRYHHKGVDLVNRPKSVVWASQNGKVIIKDRYLMTGNTVVLDHGRGVFSLYCHLEDFAEIEVGEIVKKGNPLGRLGMTGYANGYHLHWEVRVNNISVDPLEWTEKIY